MGFSIQNTRFSYDGKKVVLNIPSFEIPDGGLYFFIGSSGIGKSTLLESLGLMNNTCTGDSEKLVYIGTDGIQVDLRTLWTKDDSELSSFRMKEYSFIFQNTNLMPHFTAGENMVYTMLLEGKSWSESKQRVLEIMPSLGLAKELFDRNIQFVSGGQRQRLAFLRAFVSSFNVLFGDEPTGNLDPVTAFNMMQILSEFIKKENKTAIIVSHDIPLAAAFADKIYYIKRNDSDDADAPKGILTDAQCFEKRQSEWWHQGIKVEEDIHSILKGYL